MVAMVGVFLVELQDGSTGEPLPGFSLDDADVVKGSYISKIVSWRHGQAQSLPREFEGRALKLKVAMADASLFALEFRCF